MSSGTPVAAARSAPELPCERARELEQLLVSAASESTGHHQTCRNELWALFGVWVGFADETKCKAAFEDEEQRLRDEARELYCRELADSGASVVYSGAPGAEIVRVSWCGHTVLREMKKGVRNDARNAFIALLRKRLGVLYPIEDRPLCRPWYARAFYFCPMRPAWLHRLTVRAPLALR
jgi:hypothetical protein